MIRSAFVALVGVFVFSACDTADNTPDPIPLNVQTATDIPADPAVAIGPRGPVGLGLFALYDLDTGQIVLGSDEVDPATRAADSTGTAWDIGFRTTTIIFNGGTSGTGSVQAQLLDNTIFAELTEAPANGYIQDGQNTCPAVQTPGGTFPGTPYVI
ncbi:MAG: HmuY family protein [Bacteroidota bacterium]